MKLRSTLILLVSIFSPATTLADAHSIVGTWALEVNAPRGVQRPTLEVAADKDTYHGVFKGQRGQVAIEDIKVEDKTFGFPLTVTTPRGEMELRYSGQFDGDVMKGEIVTPRGRILFTGKRSK